MNTPQASMNINPDNNIEKTMTTETKASGDLRCKTLLAEGCFNAAAIDKLEISIKDWDLKEKIAVESTEYFGNARWGYRDSYIEGMRTEGGFEFLAITALNERQFQTFSQATTWIDGVLAGIKDFSEYYKQNSRQAQ